MMNTINFGIALSTFIALTSCNAMLDTADAIVNNKGDIQYYYDPVKTTDEQAIENIKVLKLCWEKTNPVEISKPSKPRQDGLVYITFNCVEA